MTSPTTTLEKIGKLLVQAENTTNENEANAFLTAAQRLATLAGVDLNRARMSQEAKHRTLPTQKQLRVGERGKKGLRTLQTLAAGIARANDLQVDFAHNGTYVNLYGYQEDIDITEALYTSLLVQMVTASEAFLSSGEYAKETTYREGYYIWRDGDGKRISASDARYDYQADQEWVDGGYKPVSKLTARLDFQIAFAEKVDARLNEAKREVEKELRKKDLTGTVLTESGSLSDEFRVWFLETYGNEPADLKAYADFVIEGWRKQEVERFHKALLGEVENTGTDIVLADKTKTVREHYAATSNAKGSWGGHRGAGTAVASSAGRTAGSTAQLSGQGSLPGARKALA